MKILIIQQKRIGDVLTSTILCENLKAKFPHATIDYMCYQNCVAVLENNPNIDKIIVLKEKVRKSYTQLFQFIGKIRKSKYDIVIDAYCKLETNLISYFSKASKRISYAKGYSDVFYTDTIQRHKNGSKPEIGLAIDNRLMLLKPIMDEKALVFKPKIHLSKDEKNEALKTMHENNVFPEKEPVFMINVLGSEWYKIYPVERMAKIIDAIVAQTQGKILFNYIPFQRNEAEGVYQMCLPITQKNIVLDLYSEDLRKSLALMSFCEALIGNEGGGVNMAKALEIPTFSLFSPSVDKETWQLFEDDPKNVSIHLKDIKPEIYEQHTEAYIKKNSFIYYDEYPFEQILNKLRHYLQDISKKNNQIMV